MRRATLWWRVRPVTPGSVSLLGFNGHWTGRWPRSSFSSCWPPIAEFVFRCRADCSSTAGHNRAFCKGHRGLIKKQTISARVLRGPFAAFLGDAVVHALKLLRCLHHPSCLQPRRPGCTDPGNLRLLKPHFRYHGNSGRKSGRPGRAQAYHPLWVDRLCPSLRRVRAGSNAGCSLGDLRILGIVLFAYRRLCQSTGGRTCTRT